VHHEICEPKGREMTAILGVHPLGFFTRLVHVTAMAFLLGGSLLLWKLSAQSRARGSGGNDHSLLDAAGSYEWFFWLAIGLSLLTGIGNLGTFGASLPGTDTMWGLKLALKLAFVLTFLPLSLLRTLLVIRLRPGAGSPELTTVPRLFQLFYTGTAIYLTVILLLAVSLAHA
jgi:uncharacterized membrane protein